MQTIGKDFKHLGKDYNIIVKRHLEAIDNGLIPNKLVADLLVFPKKTIFSKIKLK